MIVYTRLHLVLKHPIKEQPEISMPKNAKDTSKKGCSNHSLNVSKPKKLTNIKYVSVYLKYRSCTLKSRNKRDELRAYI